MVAMNVDADKGKTPLIVVEPSPAPAVRLVTLPPPARPAAPKCFCCLLVVVLMLGVSVFSLFFLATRSACSGRHHRVPPAAGAVSTNKTDQPTYLVSWTYIQNYISINYFLESDYVEEKQFLLVTHERVNWFKALANCQKNNMSLAAIESTEEHDQLISQIRLANLGPMDFWTSGSDLASPGEWLWMTGGRPITHSHWMRFFTLRQGLDNEAHCLYASFDSDYASDRAYCYRSKYYVCQF